MADPQQLHGPHTSEGIAVRICLVSREFTTFTGGGIGTYACEQARAYARAGHDVWVITDAHPDVEERGPRVAPGVRFLPVDFNKSRAALDAYPAFPIRHAAAVHDALQPLHAKHNFDYIEFPEYWGEGYFAIAAKRAQGIYEDTILAVRLHTPTKFVYELNREMSIDGIGESLLMMEKFCLEHADVLVAPCTSLLDYVRREFPRRGGEHDTVIHYPFDPASLNVGSDLDKEEDNADGTVEAAATPATRKPPKRRKPDSPRTTREIVYFGRLERRKGVIDLVRVADRLLAAGLDVRFRLVGADTKSGPFGSSMKAYLDRITAGRWNDRIIYQSAVPRHELIDFIKNADVCCFPSLWENFPNVCLEAMTLGAVVVGSRHGGMAEMIEHGISGFLFPGGDPDRLERAITSALSLTADQRAAMGEAARSRIASICEPSLICAKMQALVERVSESNRARAEARRAAVRGALNAGSVSPNHAPGRAKTKDNTSNPLVSVIVPYYNMAEFFPQTLESIRAQTFIDFETIIVDDGSTDPASVSLMDALASEPDSGVRVIRKPNGGLSSARNAGIAHARGTWILPLDADDVIDPDYIESLVVAAALNPNAAVISTHVSYFTTEPLEPTGGWIPFGLDQELLRYRNCAAVATGVIKKAAILDIGGYDEWLNSYEDWDVYARLAEAGHESVIVPDFLFRYRVRPDSMARTTLIDHRDQIRAYLAWKRCEGPAGDGSSSIAIRRQIAECEDLRREIAWWRGESDRLRSRITELEEYADALYRRPDPHTVAKQLIEENVRYRVADRLNVALKTVGLQRTLKSIVVSKPTKDRNGKHHTTTTD